jgi:uncharacterized protein (DUF3084 family)
MPNQTTDYLPYFFLALMIIAGGVVAWVADGLGRKIGKKRLSFMGLRPRHTATLITVGAGILIPILTIGAIFAFSKEARDWIREGRGAIERSKELQKDVSNKEKLVDDLEKERVQAQIERDKLRKDSQRLTKQVKESNTKLQTAKSQLRSAEAKTKLTLAMMRPLQAKLASTNKEVAAKRAEVEAKRREVQEGRRQLAALNIDYKKVKGDTSELNKQNLKLVQTQISLEQDLKQKESELKALEAQKAGYTLEIKSLQQAVKTYEDSIEDYTTKIRGLQIEYETISSQFKTNIAASRTRPMIFERNEELARVQLPPSLSPVAARNAYLELLGRARTVALERGALKSVNQAPAGLWQLEQNNRLISIAEQEDAIIRQITSRQEELVLVARAPVNSFGGEYVLLEFVWSRNKLVYPEGKLVVEKRIDGRKSRVEVLDQIDDFVRTNVRAQALKDGMIPLLGRNSQLGAIPRDQLFDLIEEVRSYNQLVRLQAVAKQDTMAGDQLQLIFRVRL